MKRIGFACKYMYPVQTKSKKELEELQRPFNCKSTTVSWLNAQSVDGAVERLWFIMEHNVQSFYNLVKDVGHLPDNLKMVRLSSDCLPAYTHKDWSWFYKQPDVVSFLETRLGRVGRLARKLDVRLSMHPGQFVVLASDKPDVVDRSIEEFEYHVDMVRYMGFGRSFQDFKVNVHISGKQGPSGIKRALKRLSPEALNTITIENDEVSWGIDDSIELVKHCALVLDIHHHWVYSGEYLLPNCDQHKRIIESWRGVRPVIHYSISRESLLENHSMTRAPNMKHLLRLGVAKGKLRAHSNLYWNKAVSEYAMQFLDTSDIMCEAKYKNIASYMFYQHAQKVGAL